MDNGINILDIEIQPCFAKEALKKTIAYMETDPVSVIRMVTATELMNVNEDVRCKEILRGSDMILSGDRLVLEAASVRERRILKETEEKTFLKMFFRYLHKKQARVCVLAQTPKEAEDFCRYLQRRYGGIQRMDDVGVTEEAGADDRLVNAINGWEADCVLSLLPSPVQERVLSANRDRLDVRIWLGAGESLRSIARKSKPGPVGRFIIKHIFKKELEKSSKEDSCGQ